MARVCKTRERTYEYEVVGEETESRIGICSAICKRSGQDVGKEHVHYDPRRPEVFQPVTPGEYVLRDVVTRGYIFCAPGYFAEQYTEAPSNYENEELLRRLRASEGSRARMRAILLEVYSLFDQVEYHHIAAGTGKTLDLMATISEEIGIDRRDPNTESLDPEERVRSHEYFWKAVSKFAEALSVWDTNPTIQALSKRTHLTKYEFCRSCLDMDSEVYPQGLSQIDRMIFYAEAYEEAERIVRKGRNAIDA
jgi:hypothetical protein